MHDQGLYNIRPVILSGGSGTRLWPSSRKSLPKQFISFPGTGSLLARTVERAVGMGGVLMPIVVSSRQQGFLCQQALAEHEQAAHYILEETGRNTAPAIWFVAKASDPDDILLIMPLDHWIEDSAGFAGPSGGAPKSVRHDAISGIRASSWYGPAPALRASRGTSRHLPRPRRPAGKAVRNGPTRTFS